MLNIVLFGPPGAGKGTQSEKVLKKYNLVHLSTGDLFRLHLNNETALGLEAKKYMNKGDLVPDEIVIGMVEDKINKSSNVFKNLFVVSLVTLFFKSLVTTSPIGNLFA